VETPNPLGKFTTVMQWESYRAVEYNGVRYGLKADAFLPYIDLPSRTGPIFELAIGGASTPRPLLRSKGWELVDPLEITRDPWKYEAFIRNSKAEFGVVKHGYMVSRSGWFSERSSCYLASGRPVLMQDTGFTDWMDAGLGVVSFGNFEDAVVGIESINSRYDEHCRAAREIAAAYFDYRHVLPKLLEEALNAPARVLTT
jgi:hypothetical protein